MPGARVSVTSEGTGLRLETVASEGGTYAFEALQSGLYTVAVEHQGFRRFVSRANEVTIGQPTTVNVALEVGTLAEQIEVVSSAELVQTSTSGNIGNIFSEKTLKDLPIVGTRGRNPLDLVLLQPGVVSGANSGGVTHVNGARDRAWNFTLDGIDSNETSAGGALLSPVRLNPDALAEFRVITSNATAEYGRSSGAQVTMITKSGTNEFHGKGFYFYRTPRLNANEWENNVNNTGKRQFVQNIWGGDFGGPIIRNKTFFYGNLQMLRARESGRLDRTVLTDQARRGILRYVIGGRNQPAGLPASSVDVQGNVRPGIQVGTYSVAANDPERLGLDPTLQQYINDTPLPNNFLGGDGLNTAFYSFTSLQAEKQYDAMTRIDHIFSPTNTVFGRVNWGQQDTTCDRGNGGPPLFPGRECVENTTRSPNNMAYSWRWNPTARVTNELVVGRNKFRFGFDNTFTSFDDYTLQFLAPAALSIVESTEFGNARTIKTWQVVENLAWQTGAHSLKFGANLRLQKHFDERGSVAGANVAPRVDFSTSINPVDPRTFGIPTDINVGFDQPMFQYLTNVLLGRVGQRQQSFIGNGSAFEQGLYEFEAKYNEYDLYAQDTWKVRPNLTLDLGLRWEIKMSPRSPQGIAAPNQLVTLGAPPSNTLRWEEGDLFPTRWKNFGPSIGLAWDPFGTGKTSIRSNYRIAYDRLPTFLASSFIFQSIPGKTIAVTDQEFGRAGGRLRNLPALAPPSQSPEALRQPIPFSAASNTIFDQNFKFPTTHQWSFSIQREIMANTLLDVSYIGRRAYHLLGGYNINQPEVLRNNFVREFNAVKAGGDSAFINSLTSADSRRGANESGSAMLRRLFASDFSNNAVATLANRIATQAQGGRLVTDLSGAGPFALIPYPQYAGGLNIIDSNDFSTYHSLQMQVIRRLANGFSGQVSYVWSKSLDTRSYDPSVTFFGTGQAASSIPFDINNRHLNYARSDFDRTHVFQSYFLWELPFGRGKKFGNDSPGWLNQAIGGWEMTAVVTVQTGRPMTVFSGANTFNLGVQSTANCNGCSRNLGSVQDENGLSWYFSPEERAKFSAPAAGEMGNTGRNYFTGPGSLNLNNSLIKRFSFGETRRLELRADATNVTNTPTYGFPTLTYNSQTFGRIRDTISSASRKIQVGAKIEF